MRVRGMREQAAHHGETPRLIPVRYERLLPGVMHFTKSGG